MFCLPSCRYLALNMCLTQVFANWSWFLPCRDPYSKGVSLSSLRISQLPGTTNFVYIPWVLFLLAKCQYNLSDVLANILWLAFFSAHWWCKYHLYGMPPLLFWSCFGTTSFRADIYSISMLSVCQMPLDSDMYKSVSASPETSFSLQSFWFDIFDLPEASFFLS